MYLTYKQQVKQLSKEDFKNLMYLCKKAKSLRNEAIYNIRQHFFNENKYLSYYDNCKLIKSSKNYKILNANVGQQILRDVDSMFQSYFGLWKLAKSKGYNYKDINLPKYLHEDDYASLLIAQFKISKNFIFTIPFSMEYAKTHNKIKIKIPYKLRTKSIKQIKIIPKLRALYFEIQYIYEEKENIRDLDNNLALAIDLGVNNLLTCITNLGKSFIIDGKRLKAINQWWNKHNAKLQSIKDKQKIELQTRNMRLNHKKRNNKAQDYINKATKYIIDFCIKYKIGNLVLGYNIDIQREVDLGKKTNQTFSLMPYFKIKQLLMCKCKLNGINFIEQEESYTSKASFWDKDEIPIFDENINKKYKFSGKRIKRGLYKTSTGYEFNTDCNGALNILRKSNVVSLEALYSRGKLDTPLRIRID